MATETVVKRQAYLGLNNGSTSSGSTIVKRVSLGTLDKDAWNIDKVVAIVQALQPIMSKSIYEVPAVATSNIEA